MRPTLRTIAEQAGVSLTTVSLALRGSPEIGETTRIRIKAIADKVGYVPNPVLAAGMAQLARRKPVEIGGALACVHFTEMPEIKRHEGLCAMLNGIMARAGELGYRVALERVYNESSMRRVLRQLRAQGVPGVAFFGVSWPEVEALLDTFIAKWPSVQTGPALKTQPIHCSNCDHFQGTRLAFAKARERGSQRIGLVVQRTFDRLCSGTVTGGFCSMQFEMDAGDRIEPLLDWGDQNFGDALVTWWRYWRPDAILTVQKQYSLAEWRAWNPTDTEVDLIQISRTGETAEWPGVTFPGENVGRTAVDLLVAQIHRGECGLPRYQKFSLSEGTWVEPGETLPQ